MAGANEWACRVSGPSPGGVRAIDAIVVVIQIIRRRCQGPLGCVQGRSVKVGRKQQHITMLQTA